jgi:sugar phosphate isomerase/epimerase
MQNRICLNLSALIHLDFPQQLIQAAEAGFHAIGPRAVNVDRYLAAGYSLKDASSLLDTYGLKSIEYDYSPNWVYCDDDERTAMIGEFDGFCATAAALGGDGSILVTPTLFDGRNGVLDYPLAVRNLREIARVARSYNAVVGVEFLPWTRIDSIGKAWTLMREAGSENAGIVLDCFHYFEGSSTVSELHAVPVERIALCHVNDMNTFEDDILTRTREQRVLPGEGQYKIDEILTYLKDGGYKGYYSLEILNKSYQEKDPGEITERAKRAMDSLLSNYS